MLKRFKAQALGRATMIKRKSSHITVELDLREPKVPKAAKESRVAGAKKKPAMEKKPAPKAAGKKQVTTKAKRKQG